LWFRSKKCQSLTIQAIKRENVNTALESAWPQEVAAKSSTADVLKEELV